MPRRFLPLLLVLAVDVHPVLAEMTKDAATGVRLGFRNKPDGAGSVKLDASADANTWTAKALDPTRSETQNLSQERSGDLRSAVSAGSETRRARGRAPSWHGRGRTPPDTGLAAGHDPTEGREDRPVLLLCPRRD